MGITDFIRVLQSATVISFAIGVFWALLSLLNFYRSRNDSLWRYRRQAGQRGFRFSILTVFFLALSLTLCLVTLTVNYVETQPLAENPASILPSETATTEATIEVTAETAIEVTAEVIRATEVPPTPRNPASLQILAIDDVITDDWRAIQADTTFTGVQRLYFFFSYANLAPHQLWGQQLLREGQVIQSYEQKWGQTPPQGESFFFLGDQNGWVAGNYEIRLTLDSSPVSSARFVILPG